MQEEKNMWYLPFMYFLPEELIVRCPTLRSLPRCLGKIARSPKWLDVIDSDPFINEISDAVAILVFPHFGFGGWKEHYTGYFPVWKMTYFLNLWADLLEKETGWGIPQLLRVPSSAELPFLDSDYIKDIMGRIVKRAISEQNWQPILDVIKEMPCDEDFMNWDTNVRKDFLRKWYHTRSKIKMVSLESCMENEEHGIYEVEDKSSNFEERIASEDYCQRFKARLSEKDMKILELRVEGFTYEAIAERLGYKNHSGVIKRMQTITKEFIKHEEEQQ